MLAGRTSEDTWRTKEHRRNAFEQFQFLEAKDNGGGNCVLHATILSAKSRSTNAIWVLQFFLAIIGPNDQTTPAD